MNKVKNSASKMMQPLLAIVVGLIVGAIAMVLAGESVLNTYHEMWKGAFGNFYFFTSTLERSIPIILAGLGVAFAFRAGFFNLGAEGQLVLGAVTTAIVVVYLPFTGVIAIIIAIFSGMVIAGLWSFFAGWMEQRFQINLLISTLLLNYIAVLFAGYLVSEPFRDTSSAGGVPQSVMINDAVKLPALFEGTNLHMGFIFAVVATIILAFIIKRTTFGYEVRMLGQNRFFAQYGGINRKKVMFTSMLISGMLAGLGGGVEVLGMHYRFIEGALTTPQFAWTGLMAALLANSNPIGTAVMAIFLAALDTGSLGVERNTDVPNAISDIIQAVLIIFISARFTFTFLKLKKKEGKKHGKSI
ncbi:ABC transporter permease [Saliterribacillus persicus]|uniref:Nucleoside ABC transporter membrane protein n=1 Tax=Saliterribacillus persicus TaxID=930114 RepID=A0A368XVC5_9BACI|nr:ABC transporter permease [Saliterribacillus persicus]RCW71923.1 nucleoside ABC transporter membrane protein [Saliterribacillus persicus]